MYYEEFSPPDALRPFLKCFWVLEDGPSAAPEKQRVVPDGCMELIYHYGDAFRQYFADGRFITQPRAFVFGQIDNYIEIAPTGRSGIVAARFLPEGLEPFLKIPVHSMDNRAVEWKEAFGPESAGLEQQLEKATSSFTRISCIEDFLLQQLSQPSVVDHITSSCVRAIMDAGGQLNMSTLAAQMNISKRSIERRFVEQVGLSPKQLARVVRLQAAIRMLKNGSYDNLTGLAYENGYYDQAHFIRDFREFTGISPKAFFATHLRYAALFASAE